MAPGMTISLKTRSIFSPGLKQAQCRFRRVPIDGLITQMLEQRGGDFRHLGTVVHDENVGRCGCRMFLRGGLLTGDLTFRAGQIDYNRCA